MIMIKYKYNKGLEVIEMTELFVNLIFKLLIVWAPCLIVGGILLFGFYKLLPYIPKKFLR